MADIHRALVNNPFDWWSKEIEVGKDKMPLDPTQVVKKQDQIKISFNVIVDRNREKTITLHVTPFDGAHVETFLAHTWDQYEKGANAQLPEALRTDGPTHFRLFPNVLGVSATVIWKKILDDEEIDPSADHDDEENDLSHDSFTNCVSLFLEEVAGLKYIGDAAIRWLRLAKKPAAMAPDVCFRRRATVLAYLDSGLLRSKLSRPSAYELAEAVFLAFPKPYQEKYAETHDELDEDLTPLRSAFMQYHAADVRNGTLDKIKKAKEGKKRPSDSRGDRSNKRSRRPAKYSSGRGRRGDYHDCRDGYDRRDRYDDRRDRRDRPKDDRQGRGGNRDPRKPGFKPGSGRDRPAKGTDAAHHVDDGSYSGRSRSPSPSPSASRSGRSRSPSRSPSIGDEEHAYAMSAGRSPRAEQEAPVDSLTYDDEVRSRHKEYFNSRRWKSLFKKKDSSHSESRR